MVHCTSCQKHSKPLVYRWSHHHHHHHVACPMVDVAVPTSLLHACHDGHRSTKSVLTVYQSSKTVKRQSKQHKMTIGVPIVTCLPKLYQQCTISTIVKNSQKTAKTAKTALGVPIVTGLPRLYQQCNNRPSVPIVKNSQTAKNYHWCTNRHMSTQHPPNTQSRSRVPTVLPSSE